MRTRIFLSLADDSSAQIASALYGSVAKMKASYSVSEQTSRATASLLTGSPGGGTGSLSASKSFSEHREALFHPRDFALLGNCQAIAVPAALAHAVGNKVEARVRILKCGSVSDTRPPRRRLPQVFGSGGVFGSLCRRCSGLVCRGCP